MPAASARSATAPPGQPALVVGVEPDDGRAGVFRDTPVVVRLSQPIDELSLEPCTVSVHDASGPVPGHVRLMGRRDVVVFTALRPWRSDELHFVVVHGLRDARGREVPRHLSRFVPCGFGSRDWPAAGD